LFTPGYRTKVHQISTRSYSIIDAVNSYLVTATFQFVIECHPQRTKVVCVSFAILPKTYWLPTRNKCSLIICTQMCIKSENLVMIDHRRRSCASPVLTAIGLVNGNPAFLTHTELTSLNRSLEKFVTGDYVHDFYSCEKFGGNPYMGGFWANR